MQRQDLKNLVSNGKFFSVRFIKRTDGTVRDMVARIGVKSQGGGELNYNPKDHDLLTVYDVKKRAYRNIPVDNILRVKAGGKTYGKPK